MDLQNAANYKFYTCRSLLACDSGGLVYDRSKSFDNRNYGEKSFTLSNTSQSEIDPSEKIVYIINSKSQSKTSSRSQVDLTTHLDDDEFNDYEMNSSMVNESRNEVQYSQNRNEMKSVNAKNETFESAIIQSDIDESVSNLVDEILEHEDTFAIQHSQSLQDSNSASNINYYGNVNENIKMNNSFENSTIYQQEVSNIQFSSTLSQNKIEASIPNNINSQAIREYEFDPCKNEEIVSYKRHMNKRKQIYNVKEDGFSELLDDTQCDQQSFVPSYKSKKKKLAYNKENQKERLQNQKKNPFANLKLNSILKGKKSVKRVKSSPKELVVEPSMLQYEENFASNSSCSYDDDEVLIHRKNPCHYNDTSSSSSKDDVLQELTTATQVNSDLSNADYLDYVHPREQIIESDMDKLLSPTIENESFERSKTQQSTNEIKRLVDVNGNEVGFQDIQIMSSSKSVLSPSQIAERKLFLYSANAKKLGMENFFNTSNDAVINEIIFGTNIVCEQLNLELNFMRSAEELYIKQNAVKNAFFKSVSCTLVESLKELHRFGGFIDENSQETPSKKVDSSAAVIHNGFINIAETNNFQKNDTSTDSNKLNKKDQNTINSNFTFNFSNKSNLLGLDFQPKCNVLEYQPNENRKLKRSPGPLIIKMKRINDGNNEYVIDDSSKQTRKTIQKKATGNMKTIERYECHDCSEKFRTKKSLKNHVSEYHKGPYDTECDICHMKFKKSSAHKKHQLWCPKNIAYKCNSCDRIYRYGASLTKHLKSHQR